MKEKLRTKDNKIGELEAENQRLKDEKISLERKLKNSEKLIGELLQTSGNSSIENVDLMIENANLKKENQDLKGHQLSPELKEIIGIATEAEKWGCTMKIYKKIIQELMTY